MPEHRLSERGNFQNYVLIPAMDFIYDFFYIFWVTPGENHDLNAFREFRHEGSDESIITTTHFDTIASTGITSNFFNALPGHLDIAGIL